MPELPEVETVRRSLEPHVLGRTVTSVEVRQPSLRIPVTAGLSKRLSGRTITAARRRGKYLLLDVGDGLSWIFHLGMSGRLWWRGPAERYALQRHDHIIGHLDDGARLVFHDPRRFGLTVLEKEEGSRLFAHTGPEPLDPDAFDEAYLRGFRSRTRRTVKDVLMDQRVVAGLGNIYVNEILFVAGIRPRRRFDRLTLAECDRLVSATREIIGEAVEHRGTSISDFLDGIGRKGGYQWRLRVYSRAGEPCVVCGTELKGLVIAARATVYCPACQK